MYAFLEIYNIINNIVSKLLEKSFKVFPYFNSALLNRSKLFYLCIKLYKVKFLRIPKSLKLTFGCFYI